jgi:metal-sulfur cluster biosynthetic enzyme
MITTDAVLGVLGSVRDPELDEPLTDLGFVAGVHVDGTRVEVRLRLPTYFCAPNFAWMMVEGARSAVRALPEVEDAVVVLEDHFASDEISGAASRAAGFEHAFPGETNGDLTELRDLFARKAFVARQARLCEGLLRTGRTLEELVGLRLADLEPGQELDRCVALRGEMGLDASPGAPAFVLPDGQVPDAESLGRWLRLARVVRVSIEANAGMCRALLETRYGLDHREELVA